MSDKGNFFLKEHVETWYDMNNIIRERCELYCDFFISLIRKINETYLGPDVLFEKEDIISHFTWCIKQVIEDFKRERIFFKEEGTHIKLLTVFFYDTFYTSKNENIAIVLEVYFKRMFNYNKDDLVEVTVMTEFYKLLNQNLIK